MIDICCLVRYEDLYERMVASAKKTYSTDIFFSRVTDPGFPDLSRSYNEMGSKSKADILLFVHDDIVFLEYGWDVKLIEALSKYEVAGVCGSVGYTGGKIFDSGKLAGKIVGLIEGQEVVKVVGDVNGHVEVTALDGCFLAINSSHFNTHKFDEYFDGIFFYDIDYCLRSKCCVVDILVEHSKPPKYYGKYPSDLKPIENYWDKFHLKHGLTPSPERNKVCKAMLLKDYQNPILRNMA